MALSQDRYGAVSEADLCAQIRASIGEQRFRDAFTAASRLSRSEAVALVRE